MLKRTIRLNQVILLGACLALISGCGGSGVADTEGVTGVVTYNGTPVADASITFTPNDGPSATGITNSSGEFSLSTLAEGDGAVTGTHKVAIMPNASQIEPMPGTPEAEQAASGRPPFPERYSDPEQSGFTANVEKSGKNHFTFQMTD